jgi:hypothetical protein
LQNYYAGNQPYLQGLNQLQSNDLSYMNYGQGAQNQAFQQNAYNNQQMQNTVSSLASGAQNVYQNTDWTKVGNNISSWFGSGTSNGGSGSIGAQNGYGNYDWIG